MLHPLRTRGWTIVWLAVLVAIPALTPASATAQDTTAAAATGLSPQLLRDASWHGRPIQRPLPPRSGVAERSAGLRPGSGYHRPAGSRRVRALQRRLTRLGYRPGPSDGLYGPRTQAAVHAFQHKHGLPRTGQAGPQTLSILRRRTTPGASTRPATPTTTTPPRPTPAPPVTPARPLTPAPAADTGDGLPLLAVILLIALVLPLLMLAGLLLSRRRQPTTPGPAPQPRALPPAPQPEPLLQPQPTLAPEPITPQTPPITRPPHPHHHAPPHQRRAALRERILTMRAHGMTLQQIADQLTTEGQPTLGGGRHWQPWSVRAATRPFNPAPRPATPTKEVR